MGHSRGTLRGVTPGGTNAGLTPGGGGHCRENNAGGHSLKNRWVTLGGKMARGGDTIGSLLGNSDWVILMGKMTGQCMVNPCSQGFVLLTIGRG